jgi:transcriptional regulator with XRE-family HTH domain
MDIRERILAIIEYYNLNVNSFSKKIGMSNNVTIGNIVGGRKSQPSLDTINKIVAAFPGLNKNWILSGDGEMLSSNSDTPFSSSINLKSFRTVNDIPQKEIVEVTGLSQGFISEIEKGIKSLPKYAYDKLLNRYADKIKPYVINTEINVSEAVSRIKQFRESKGLTQLQFAESLGLEQGSYSDIERGKVGLSNNVKSKLQEVYRLRRQWIDTGKGEMYFDEDVQFIGLSEDTAKRVDELEQAIKLVNVLLESEKDKVKQLEARLKDKDDMIALLKEQFNNLKK